MTDLDDMLDHHSLITSKLKEEIMIPMKGIYKYGSTMQYVIPLEVLSLMPITFRMLNIVGTGGLEITYRKMDLHKLTTDFRKVEASVFLTTYSKLKIFIEALKEAMKAYCRKCQFAELNELSSGGSYCTKRDTFIRSNRVFLPFNMFVNGKWESSKNCSLFQEKE